METTSFNTTKTIHETIVRLMIEERISPAMIMHHPELDIGTPESGQLMATLINAGIQNACDQIINIKISAKKDPDAALEELHSCKSSLSEPLLSVLTVYLDKLELRILRKIAQRFVPKQVRTTPTPPKQKIGKDMRSIIPPNENGWTYTPGSITITGKSERTRHPAPWTIMWPLPQA